MPRVALAPADVSTLLTQLLGRDVAINSTPSVEPHAATRRGLVTDDNQLVAVVGGSIAFAHQAGAALAMIPAATLADHGDDPSDDLLEIYTEVANVVSRLLNELVAARIRLDPGLVHSDEALDTVVSGGELVLGCTADISGYGSGSLGIWFLPVR